MSSQEQEQRLTDLETVPANAEQVNGRNRNRIFGRIAAGLFEAWTQRMFSGATSRNGGAEKAADIARSVGSVWLRNLANQDNS
jgi:hypothetical protein